MKTIIIHLDDEDFELLMAAKGEHTWRELIMTTVTPKQKKEVDKDGKREY